MLLVYSHQVNNRIKYTFDLVLGSILGVSYRITNDPGEFLGYAGAKISYAVKPLGDELFFSCDGLLHETGIKNISGLPADPFALSFLLASRYEEYLPFQADHYGRFPGQASLSFKHGILYKPVINIFAMELRKMITARYPGFHFPERKYSFVPTIDVDNAYAYKGKSTMRTLGGFAKAFLKLDADDVIRRARVLAGSAKDPYDTYDFLFDLHEGLRPVYFFLLADWAPYDKNLRHDSPSMLTLIRKVAAKAGTGIHPSYASNQDSRLITTEKERLSRISGRPVHKSRQHFLMLRFPQTYRSLIASGITDDYTMGYADEPGFRAGICTPYPWYDLEKETVTSLTIHPFAVMDGTLNHYLGLTPAQAVVRVEQIIEEIRKVDGEFISIWHNETLSEWRQWKGWRKVYQEVIKAAV